MDSFKILTIHSYVAFGLTTLFLYQTIVNYFVFKQNVINRSYMKSQIGLCAFSTLYTFISFLLVLKVSVPFNLLLLHIMWISGSLGNYFYISSVKSFLNDKSKSLIHIQKLTLISAGGAFTCLMIWAFTGNNLFIDWTVPFVEYNNIYMQHIGGMNPGPIVKTLSIFVVIPSIYCSIYFLRYLMKSETSQKMLLAGIVFNLFAILNDCLISFWDPAYLLPIMFMAHLFEILRMTYSNQLQVGKKLDQVTYDLIQSSKLSEAGTHFAVLAHEILNPLTAAMGYLERLQKKMDKVNLTPEIADYLSKINRQHKKIEFLAKNVKKYTKVNFSTDMAAINLGHIIQDSLNTIDISAMKAGVSIKYRPTSPDYQISCFQDQIIQVITNILNNAVEAISSQDEKWIEIHQTLKNDSKTVLISIKDSGKGIPRDVQERMWESRFTTKKDTGVGLGLSICSSIITNHGGEIYLNSESLNTEFIIEFPLAIHLI